MKAVLNALEAATVRIERVILIAGAIAADVMSDDLNDFFEDSDDETIEKCLGEIPEWVDSGSRSDLTEWLREEVGKTGFLIEFSTPVMRGCSYSWSHYYTTWVYAETIEEAVESASNWSKERRKKFADKLKGGA